MKILVILFFICVSGFSQDFQGKAYYMSKVNLNMDWMKNMPPDRQAYMKGRMKSATEKNYTLCLVAGDKKASLNKIKKILNIKDASMASADDVKNVTGFTIGGVSPIGHLNETNILIDSSLERFNYLFAAAGHPNCVFKINFKDLNKITNGLIKELVE